MRLSTIALLTVVVLPSLVLGCEYKPAMTDAEISACRQPGKSEPAPHHQAPAPRIGTNATTPKMTAEELYQQQVRQQAADAERERTAAAEAALGSEAKVGMTKTEFAHVQKVSPYYCIGPRINKTVTAHGTHEQWVCYAGEVKYVYFDNDVLTAIQE